MSIDGVITTINAIVKILPKISFTSYPIDRAKHVTLKIKDYFDRKQLLPKSLTKKRFTTSTTDGVINQNDQLSGISTEKS